MVGKDLQGKVALITGGTRGIGRATASSPDVEGVTGKYFDHKQQEARTSNESYNQRLAQRLWHVSAELTKLAVDQQPPAVRETTQLVLSF